MTDDVFAVIAEATRRDILIALRKGDKAVGELVQELEASQPTISKHLKVLREADLVSMRAQGQKRYYTLNPKPLAGIASWLQAFDVGPAATRGRGRTPSTPKPCPAAGSRTAWPRLPLPRSAVRSRSPRSPPQHWRAALPARPLSPAVVIPGGTAARRRQHAPADRADRGPRRDQGRRSPGQPAQVRPQEVDPNPVAAYVGYRALKAHLPTSSGAGLLAERGARGPG